MERVIVTDTVAQKVEALVDVLFDKGYFAIKENAVKYVTLLKDFINTIPAQLRYPTKNHRYGKWYCRYSPNRNTTWYITFDTNEQTWLIRNIFNNHVPGYITFIRGIK